VQDQGLYQKLLGEVVAADAAQLPEQRLANELAKRRAKTLIEKKAMFFNQANPEPSKKKQRL
jgi:hypothetical protein